MKLVIRNKYCGIIDEKEINDISEVEDIKDRYFLWYPITFDEFSFDLEDWYNGSLGH